MKTNSIIITIICGLSVSAVSQSIRSNGSGTNYTQGSTNNCIPSSNSGGNNYRAKKPDSGGSNNLDRDIASGRHDTNGGYGVGGITNEDGSAVISNGLGLRGVTNGFGHAGITNQSGSSGTTNRFGVGSMNNGRGAGNFIDETNYADYTNRYYRHKNPNAIDPLVMGNSGLNTTN